jgi:DnaJ-domain-containing protein 1
MGIWDRIGDVIKSYLNSEDESLFGASGQRWRGGSSDPDLDAAFEELDEFLSMKGRGRRQASSGDGAWTRGEDAWSGGQAWGSGDRSGGFREETGNPGTGGVPETLGQDFAELGLRSGASEEDCKAAYKQLLKKHHPDRHAGHPGNMKKATEKTARINAAYDRIARWRQTGKAD